MNFKLALAAAAVVGLAGTAQAADLAKKAPAAANYVKVCDAYGAGFFYIPGSETCLKIGGYVRAEYRIWGGNRNGVAGNPGWSSRTQNGITTRARADFNFDARTATEMGLLRSFIDIWTTADSGGATTPSLRKAFVQFGGLTAGRATSFFDFYTGNNANSVFHVAASDANVNLLGYTFGFGNGITASLSIEDGSTSDDASFPNGGGVRRALYSAANPTYYGGVKTPDLVANVNITQAWGSAQIMGVLHDDYGVTDSKLGYAIAGGVKINLPMLGAGDNFGAQVAYTKGAIAYVNGGGAFSNAWIDTADFYINGAGDFSQSSAWAVAAGLTHNWTKQVSTSITGSYLSYKDGFSTPYDYKQTDLQGNVVWTPVSGLAISANIEYRNVDRQGFADGNAYVGFLRVQRGF